MSHRKNGFPESIHLQVDRQVYTLIQPAERRKEVRMDGGVRDHIPSHKGSLVTTTDPLKIGGCRIPDPIPRNYRERYKLHVAPKRTDLDEASILREQEIARGRI